MTEKGKGVRITLTFPDKARYKLYQKILYSRNLEVSSRVWVLIQKDLSQFLAEEHVLRKMREGRKSSKVKSSTKISSKESPSTLPSPSSDS